MKTLKVVFPARRLHHDGYRNGATELRGLGCCVFFKFPLLSILIENTCSIFIFKIYIN